MNEGSSVPVKHRENQFFEIGVVGRKTGFTVPQDVKKGADGFDDMDAYFLSDGSIHLEDDQEEPSNQEIAPEKAVPLVSPAVNEQNHVSPAYSLSNSFQERDNDPPSSPLLMNSKALRASREFSGPLMASKSLSRSSHLFDEPNDLKYSPNHTDLSYQKKQNKIVDFSRMKQSPDKNNFEPRRSSEFPNRSAPSNSNPPSSEFSFKEKLPVSKQVQELRKSKAWNSPKKGSEVDEIRIRPTHKAFPATSPPKPQALASQTQKIDDIIKEPTPLSSPHTESDSSDIPLSQIPRTSEKVPKIDQENVQPEEDGTEKVVKRRGRPRKQKSEANKEIDRPKIEEKVEKEVQEDKKRRRGRPKKKELSPKPEKVNVQEDSQGISDEEPLNDNQGNIHQIDESHGLRRSNRTRIAPLAFWKNERVVYELNKNKTETPALPEVKTVIRIDDPASQRRRRKKIRSERRKQDTEEPPATNVPVEEDVNDLSPFNEEVNCPVLSWNQKNQKVSETRTIGYALPSVKLYQIRNQQTKFASLFSDPNFFGAGILELPAGAEKPVKPSKHNLMSFCILQGYLEIMVNTTTFRMRREGVFIVPRGNYYSIKNIGHELARLYYTQAADTLDDERRYNKETTVR
ncbi:CENP-C protein [Schizosaccharomyces cryophilus OY26]|uniref:CENP-C homolog n=1 Tax=Schizosaccharomyces cryophilus (strain OY26 / ATCC MYA-4695 / CBS 11777 / NBRC 106824 / NRRL Y48691) TaxID=653667 RepID=S9W4Q0_SCHCR|nr:CENP-C protein [Schizosaccharomyces cryophilus OY26]EPY53499.1 CENP-C protein [Schizosaccharomyces cryophilus OY26]